MGHNLDGKAITNEVGNILDVLAVEFSVKEKSTKQPAKVVSLFPKEKELAIAA